MSRSTRSPLAAIPILFAAWTLGGCTATGALVGAAATTTTVVLQERSTRDAMTDLEIKVSLNNRLLNHSRSLFANVSTDVVEGRVLLTGQAPTRQDKIEAVALAWETPGVVAVEDELEVGEDRGAAGYLEDAWISSQVRGRLIGDPKISSLNYNIETIDKVVHLVGLAKTRDELRRATEQAGRVKGVRQVVSHVLTIDDPRRVGAGEGDGAGAKAAAG